MTDWKAPLRAMRRFLFGGSISVSGPSDNRESTKTVPDSAMERPAPPRINADRKGKQRSALANGVEAGSTKPHLEAPCNETGTSPIEADSSSSAALPRQKYFKQPDPWVTEGEKLQAVAFADGRPVEIVIGLDFGTSFTKAAVGFKDKIFPVTWEGISSYPSGYLLPTEYSKLAENRCFIGQVPGATPDQIRQRLKHPFVESNPSEQAVAEAAVFVGLVLRYVRAWTFRVHGDTIGKSPIRWMLNLGAPSNGLENGPLEKTYRRLAAVAWSLSQIKGGEISLEAAIQQLGKTHESSTSEGLLASAVIPEFIGQITGYVKSAQRRSGLHLLVDVGGGTLDVVTFIVHNNNGQDVFPFLVPEVKPLGTQMLDGNRLVGAIAHGLPPDELQPVLEPEFFANRCRIPLAHIQERDGIFWEQVRTTVHRVLQKTRRDRDPKSQHWQIGLPTFLTGGGAKVAGYQNAITAGGKGIASSLNTLPLPPHPALADFHGTIDDYQRISVACGLAVIAFNLGEIRPARAVEDFTLPQAPAQERPTHEDIYG